MHGANKSSTGDWGNETVNCHFSFVQRQIFKILFRQSNPRIYKPTNLLILRKPRKLNPTKIKYFTVTGDFNIKEIDWELEMSTGGEQHIATKFIELIRDNYLFQHIKEPTREREGTTPSTLDLIFTNERNMIELVELVV